MLYMNTRSMVRSPDGDTQFFEITTGVLQCDTIAPFLFIICLDYVLKSSIDCSPNFGFTLKKRRSRRHPATYITDTDYADDIAITADSMENIKQLLNQIEEKAKYIGLKINCGKTEYMSFNQKEDHVLTNSEGTTLKKVKDFNYLGCFIGSTTHDIDVRIAKAWGAITSMTKLWKSKISERLNRNFFRATVEFVLTYGATTWTLIKTLENRLNGSYTRMLRAALNKSWKEHLTNE